MEVSSLKNIMIIGAMKAGTTSLFDYLKLHPEFCGSIVKETEYFSERMGNTDLKKKKYSELFNIKPTHKFTLEASTGYTKFPAENNVPQRIMEYGLNPYFIYIVRNPIDRIESHYNFMNSQKKITKKQIPEHFINISKYNMQLLEYEKVFGKDKILIINFEDLKKNFGNVCKRIYDFVGASNVIIERNLEKRNVTKPVNHVTLNMKKKTRNLKKYLPDFVIKLGLSVFSLFFPPKKRELTLKEKEELKNLLRDDMMQLQKNYNVNIAEWGF